MRAPHATHTFLNTANFAHPPRNVNAFGLKPGMVVADLGSGSGAYVLEIAQRLNGTGDVFAVDIQRDLLRKTHNEASRRGFKNVRVMWGNIEQPGGSKLPDESCDIVLVSNLLFQVEERIQVFIEARRIMKPEGRVIVIDWQESFGGMGPIKRNVVDKIKAARLAADAGLEVEREFYAGAHHYGLIFAREGVNISYI